MVDPRSTVGGPQSAGRAVARPAAIEQLDWRKVHLERIVGEGRRPGRGRLWVGLLLVVVLAAWGGWYAMAPRAETGLEPDLLAPIPDVPHSTAAAQVEPPPRPYRDRFTIRPGDDGKDYLVYTITADDDLKTIGEMLHDVSGYPRVLTYKVVEDAYWLQFFNYDQQNVDVTKPERVREHAGQFLQITLPIADVPDVDLAARVRMYNQF
jgi:hypothetical protein